MVFLLIVFLVSTARATITIVSFEGNTFSSGEGRLLNSNNNNVEFHTIYGGYSGTCINSTKDSVCNSCEGGGNGVFPCNHRRIHDDLIFSLRFRTTDTGPILITTDSDDNQVILENVFGPAGDIPGNSEVRIGIRWGEICQKIFGGTSCDEDQELKKESFSIRIGIDSNRDGKFHSSSTLEYSTNVRLAVLKIDHGENVSFCHSDTMGSIIGVCNFSIYPGDEKVYVDDIRGGCDFPSKENNQVRAVRVFYMDGSQFNSNNFVDLPLGENEGTCSENTKVVKTTKNEVGGLTNGKEYFFRIGLVDKAGNVGFMIQDSSDENFCFHKGRQGRCHSAIPAKVKGLTEDERDCFITTATYGSSLSPKVKTFRKFRNRFLKTNILGRLIIKTYYRYSPFLANWINDHPKSRVFWKIFLWPFWLFAKICLDWFFYFLNFLLLLIVVRKKILLKVES